MINTYSQRVLNPYSGHVQIAESDHARAVSMDGENWEIHFLKTVTLQPAEKEQKPKGILSRVINYFRPLETDEPVAAAPSYKRAFARVGQIKQSDLKTMLSRQGEKIDDRILELANFLLTAKLPFPANDLFEYWLLDRHDESPLALIHSCSKVEEQKNFRFDIDWAALPDAVMPIDKSEEEKKEQSPPVNSRFERLVAEQAGSKPKGGWFQRHANETTAFPPLLVKENWQHQEQEELCQRYLERQSPRLLMLHGLKSNERKRMEMAARSQSLEVDKYFPLYPEISDEKVMNSIRVEARLRKTRGEEAHSIKYPWS